MILDEEKQTRYTRHWIDTMKSKSFPALGVDFTCTVQTDFSKTETSMHPFVKFHLTTGAKDIRRNIATDTIVMPSNQTYNSDQ